MWNAGLTNNILCLFRFASFSKTGSCGLRPAAFTQLFQNIYASHTFKIHGVGNGVANGSAFREYYRKPRFAIAPIQPPPARRDIPSDEQGFEMYLENELRETLANDDAKPKRKRKKQTKLSKLPRLRIVEGDMVQVISGKFKGKSGQVLKIRMPKKLFLKQKVEPIIWIKDVNVMKVKYMSGNRSFQFDTVEEECPISFSLASLIDPKDKKPTRVHTKFRSDGSRIRLSKRTNSIIPWPVEESVAVEVFPVDTFADDVLEHTFVGR